MEPGVETEIKLGLPDETAWSWVRDRIGPVRVVQQTNHYFDTAARGLARARIGVRLRATSAGLRLTAKGEAPGAATEVITRRIELERDRAPDDLADALAHGLDLGEDVAAWRTEAAGDVARTAFLDRLERALDGARPTAIGAFRNERSIGSLRLVDEAGALRIEVELDRTTFPGARVDFELEVERSSEPEGRLDRTRSALERWLEGEGSIRPFARESKLARFEAILEGGESETHRTK
ncbi:MAG: CYTH domain-containing protein [Myxococcota bacterium]